MNQPHQINRMSPTAFRVRDSRWYKRLPRAIAKPAKRFGETRCEQA
ncbi:MAG: hypothetical protein NTY87_13200 [Planctomycetia bacterium]|nr:hypothetical protein [Planctomycetia bacterium]